MSAKNAIAQHNGWLCFFPLMFCPLLFDYFEAGQAGLLQAGLAYPIGDYR